MMNEINADYSKNFLLPPSLEDWIPIDHPVRFIKEFVESLNLSELGFKDRNIQKGRPNYSNDLLLKIWLYGYFEKIYSTRELEKACKDRMALVWLTGMNYPDHNTIWRFFKKNRAIIKEVFKSTIKLAINNDMVGFAIQAIDGTKIYADVSRQRSIHLKDLKRLLSKLDESLDEIISGIAETGKQDSNKPSYKLPKRLQSKDNLKRLISKGLEKYTISEKKELKKIVQSNINELEGKKKKSLSLTDKDCRMMKNQITTDYCYNAQSVVDERNRIIVGSKVSNAETDKRLLTEMLDETRENCNRKCEESLVDGGYFTGVELKKAEDKGYPVITNTPENIGKNTTKKNKQDPIYPKNKFKYDSKNDEYICPLGTKLKYQKTIKRKAMSYPVKIYVCKSYRECKNRYDCSKDKRGKTLERSPYEDSIQRQIKKNKLEKNKELYKKRGQIIEPVFGWIKHNNGFNRWLYRGLENVEAQWNLVCTSINLNRLFKSWKERKIQFQVKMKENYKKSYNIIYKLRFYYAKRVLMLNSNNI